MTHSRKLAAILFATLSGYLLPSITTTHNVWAQVRLSPEPRVWETPNNELLNTPTDPSIYVMVAGPMGGSSHDDGDPTRWRVALSCAEVYCSVEFDYIEHQQEYEGFPRIIASYWLNGAEIAPVIDTDSDFLHDLHFVAWETWDRVILRESDRHFRIQLNPDQTFTILP